MYLDDYPKGGGGEPLEEIGADGEGATRGVRNA